MEMKNSNTKSSQRVREMVQIALMTALTYLSVSYLNIPNGYGGVVHLGDSVIFITAILLGTRQAAISGAIGMTMFDAFSPYAAWAPYTFVIKLGMALIVGFIANSGNTNGNSWIRNIIGIILAGAWGVAGYYGAEALMTGNLYTPILSMLGNIIQVTAGGAIAVVLLIALKNTRYFKR
ncbi:MAG: hypothetical protein A2Y23_04595 [Clostridiales bacterium GWB2_37_7]|nr:MAG: hypothetical protein A2Y23_04595 [Clostridiales bacterium GWB2_37_7]